MDNAVRILLIEDDEDDFILVRDLMAEAALPNHILDWVDNYDSALEVMKENRHDVYLLDYRLGSRTGLDLLREVTARGCRGPIIFLTGLEDYDVDMGAMRAGAADYLIKQQINAPLLERSIRYAIEHKLVEEELRRARDELEIRVQERTEELVRANKALHSEIGERKRAEQERERLIHDLQDALARIKRLQGLLPICASCKKSGMAKVIGINLKPIFWSIQKRNSPTVFVLTA